MSTTKKYLSDISLRNLYQGVLDFFRASLIKNASYLIGAEITNSLFGFLFWSISAKLYTPEEIGKASALLSGAALVSLFAGFGLGDGLVRLLPESERQERLVTSVIIFTGMTSLGIAALLIIFPSIGPDKLDFLYDDSWAMFLFLGYSVFSASLAMLRMLYLAKKNTQFVLFQSLLNNFLRVGVIFFLPLLGFVGLMSANLFGVFAAVGIGLIFYLPKALGKPLKFDFSFQEIALIFPFSIGNYFANLLGQIPRRLVPLLSLLILGTASAGYGQIAWMIASFITFPGIAISSSAFSEVSNQPDNSRVIFKKALISGEVATILIALVTIIISPWILMVFGKGYVSEGTGMLRWLAFASPLVVVDWLYFSVLRFQKRLGVLIIFNCLLTVTIIGAAYYLMPLYGLTGYGIGWAIGHLLVLVGIIFDWNLRGYLILKKI